MDFLQSTNYVWQQYYRGSKISKRHLLQTGTLQNATTQNVMVSF